MLAAIERGRTPSIDFLNGEVVSRGEKRGVPAPFKRRVCETVWAFAGGTLRSARETLDRLCDPDPA
jgi:2-dehydropantoate 2-reductase